MQPDVITFSILIKANCDVGRRGPWGGCGVPDAKGKVQGCSVSKGRSEHQHPQAMCPSDAVILRKTATATLGFSRLALDP